MKNTIKLTKISAVVLLTLGLTACDDNTVITETTDTSTNTPKTLYAVAHSDLGDAGNATDEVVVFKFSEVNQTNDIFDDRKLILTTNKENTGYVSNSSVYGAIDRQDFISPPGFKWVNYIQDYDLNNNDVLDGRPSDYTERNFTSAENAKLYFYKNPLVSNDQEYFETRWDFDANNLMSEVNASEGAYPGDPATATQEDIITMTVDTTTSPGSTITTRSYDRNNDTIIDDVRTITIDDATGNVTSKTFDDNPITPNIYDELLYVSYDTDGRLTRLQGREWEGTTPNQFIVNSTDTWVYGTDGTSLRKRYVGDSDAVGDLEIVRTYNADGQITSRKRDGTTNNDFTTADAFVEYWTYNSDGMLTSYLYDDDPSDLTYTRYDEYTYDVDNKITHYLSTKNGTYTMPATGHNDYTVIAPASVTSNIGLIIKETDYRWFTTEPTCAEVYDGETLDDSTQPSCSVEFPTFM